MGNQNVELTLDEAVGEVLGLLTGLDLTYEPDSDRYRTITRQLNRALRANALEAEWSYYSSVEDIGVSNIGDRVFALRPSIRPRIIGDDAVRLVDADGKERVWAYFLPRDSLHKYHGRGGLWASVVRSNLEFSRELLRGEAGMHIHVPVMREPRLFELPPASEDPTTDTDEVPLSVRNQTVDFDYPDVVVLRAAYYYAQADPVTQPRAQTLEKDYKDLMYQLIERDTRHTDAPYLNEFFVPISGNLVDPGPAVFSSHPHSDERRF